MPWLMPTPHRAISGDTALIKRRVWSLNKDHVSAVLGNGLCRVAPGSRGRTSSRFLLPMHQGAFLLRDILTHCSSCTNSHRTQSHLPVSPFLPNSSDTELDPSWPYACVLPHITLPAEVRGQAKLVITWPQPFCMEKAEVFFSKYPSLFYLPKQPSPQCTALAAAHTNLSPRLSPSLAHRCLEAVSGSLIQWFSVFRRGGVPASIWISLWNMKLFPDRFNIRTINHLKIKGWVGVFFLLFFEHFKAVLILLPFITELLSCLFSCPYFSLFSLQLLYVALKIKTMPHSVSFPFPLDFC